MDINGISQAMTAAADITKPTKETEKKTTEKTTAYEETAAAEYTKSEGTEKKTQKRDNATIEKLLAEAMAFYFDRAHDDFLEPVDDDAYVIGYDACEDEGFSAAAEDETPYGLDE